MKKCSIFRTLSVIYDMVKVFVGHSMASLSEGELGIAAGARFITHLFNAMLPVSTLVFAVLFCCCCCCAVFSLPTFVLTSGFQLNVGQLIPAQLFQRSTLGDKWHGLFHGPNVLATASNVKVH